MYYITNDEELTAVADAIREKGGTSDELMFPNNFISAIQAIKPQFDPIGVLAGTAEASVDAYANSGSPGTVTRSMTATLDTHYVYLLKVSAYSKSSGWVLMSVANYALTYDGTAWNISPESVSSVTVEISGNTLTVSASGTVSARRSAGLYKFAQTAEVD